MKWRVVGKLTSAFPETQISDHELLCAHGTFEVTITLEYIFGCGVFATAKEIIKGNNI